MKKLFDVTLVTSRYYNVLVEASDEKEAKELALAGEWMEDNGETERTIDEMGCDFVDVIERK